MGICVSHSKSSVWLGELILTFLNKFVKFSTMEPQQTSIGLQQIERAAKIAKSSTHTWVWLFKLPGSVAI